MVVVVIIFKGEIFLIGITNNNIWIFKIYFL